MKIAIFVLAVAIAATVAFGEETAQKTALSKIAEYINAQDPEQENGCVAPAITKGEITSSCYQAVRIYTDANGIVTVLFVQNI